MPGQVSGFEPCRLNDEQAASEPPRPRRRRAWVGVAVDPAADRGTAAAEAAVTEYSAQTGGPKGKERNLNEIQKRDQISVQCAKSEFELATQANARPSLRAD